MNKSKSLEQIKPKHLSEIFMNPLMQSMRLKKSNKDPFFQLNRNVSAKLLPASPSGLRLPSLRSKLTPTALNQEKPLNKMICKTSKNDSLFTFSRLKLFSTESNAPKTPYFKIRRKNQLISAKEFLSARNRKSEIKFEEISFGKQ